jgi:hypothetical protein
MNIVTKSTKNTFLRTKNRFYIAGWTDGEQSVDIIVQPDSSDYQDYLDGYAEARENSYTQEGC